MQCFVYSNPISQIYEMYYKCINHWYQLVCWYNSCATIIRIYFCHSFFIIYQSRCVWNVVIMMSACMQRFFTQVQRIQAYHSVLQSVVIPCASSGHWVKCTFKESGGEIIWHADQCWCHSAGALIFTSQRRIFSCDAHTYIYIYINH